MMTFSPLLCGPMCRHSKQAQLFVCENDLVTHYYHFYSNYCVIYILTQQVLHSTATSYLATQYFPSKRQNLTCTTLQYWTNSLFNLLTPQSHHDTCNATPQRASIPRAEPQITAVILPQHNRRLNLHQLLVSGPYFETHPALIMSTKNLQKPQVLLAVFPEMMQRETFTIVVLSGRYQFENITLTMASNVTYVTLKHYFLFLDKYLPIKICKWPCSFHTHTIHIKTLLEYCNFATLHLPPPTREHSAITSMHMQTLNNSTSMTFINKLLLTATCFPKITCVDSLSTYSRSCVVRAVWGGVEGRGCWSLVVERLGATWEPRSAVWEPQDPTGLCGDPNQLASQRK